jgi:3-dehydro-L-gulonate 2-dehydrogenase
MRILFDDVVRTLHHVLIDLGFDDEPATKAASLFAEASLDGVASHGINRFPRFVRMVRNGCVVPRATPTRLESNGAWERWDGHLGAGPLNASFATDRAIALARSSGVGCVGLGNTNHWMRGGNYGWQAAAADCAFIGWTNTMPNMAPWGSHHLRVGNNPLVVAVPTATTPVVLDMAMSQFSYGKLDTLARSGASTPVDCGWDEHGQPTSNPAAVLRSGRVMPTGYWKGSGLALVLDLLATACSGGNATHDIPGDPERESGLSQVFIAIDLSRSSSSPAMRDRLADVVEDYVAAVPTDPASPVRYPGARALQARHENLSLGVPVDASVWREILAMTGA